MCFLSLSIQDKKKRIKASSRALTISTYSVTPNSLRLSVVPLNTPLSVIMVDEFSSLIFLHSSTVMGCHTPFICVNGL